MLHPEIVQNLCTLQSQGVSQIMASNYDIRASQILWHLRRTVGFDQWVWGVDYLAKHGQEYHHVADIMTWQESLYVDNLLSMCQMSDNDLFLNLLFDAPELGMTAPRVVVYGEYRILADGNHRLWHLTNRGITEAVFKTVYFEDRGDLDWSIIPTVEY